MPEHFISLDEAESDLLACATFLAESIKSSDGHAEAMMAVIPRYLAKGNVDLAAELANTVDDPFTRDRLLILTAEKCAEIGDDEYAMQLAEAVEDYGLQMQARERVALQRAAKGDFEKAREIAADIDHADVVLAGIAVKQSSDGDEAAALKTIDEIDFPSSAVSALQTIAISRIEKNEQDEAVDLLDKATAYADDIEHSEEKIRVHCEIGNLYIEAKRSEKAIEIFARARDLAEALDNIHRDAFLAAVAVGFMNAGSVDLADRTLDLVADKTQIATTLLGFARQLWRKDEKNDAFEALEESYAILKSQRDIETRSSKERYSLFTSIAAQFAGFERGERAIEIAENIEDETEMMSAPAQIAQIMTVQRNAELARQAIRAIPEDANRVFALIGMSDAKGQDGEKERAKEVLDEAMHLAETVPQLASRSAAYNQIAVRFNQYEYTANAREIAGVNLETISEIRDESNRAVALINLAEFFEQTGFNLSDSNKQILQSMVRKSSV